jgi:GTP pyrophosphokinase
MIERAYTVAAAWHRGQQRRSGDPYITHPVAVAVILAKLRMSPQVLCAALLHDVLEDTPCTLIALRSDVGGEIADLVDKVTRLDKAHFESMAETVTATQSINDSPALMIKLADRLHNMRTLRYLTPVKQQQKSREALEGFAPLARTLGMGAIERELVDLAAAVLTGTRDDQPSATLPGQTRTVGVSRRLLATTAVLLPAPVRERWLEEWTGELSTLPSRRSRARFTIGMLTGMPRLAAALRLPAGNASNGREAPDRCSS